MHRQSRSNRLIKDTERENTFPEAKLKPRNNERHHRKSVEEEMHLRPLNERHHKFPNPALLNTVHDDKVSPQITKQKFIKQVKSRNKTNGKRMLKERRYKRNRSEHALQVLSSVASSTESTLKPLQNKATINQKYLAKIRRIRELEKDDFLPKPPYLWY